MKPQFILKAQHAHFIAVALTQSAPQIQQNIANGQFSHPSLPFLSYF